MFDTAFHRSYPANLEHIVLGPPEDIGGLGGIWDSLLARAPEPNGSTE